MAALLDDLLNELKSSCKYCHIVNQPLSHVSYNSIIEVLIQVVSFLKLKADAGKQ